MVANSGHSWWICHYSNRTLMKYFFQDHPNPFFFKHINHSYLLIVISLSIPFLLGMYSILSPKTSQYPWTISHYWPKVSHDNLQYIGMFSHDCPLSFTPWPCLNPRKFPLSSAAPWSSRTSPRRWQRIGRNDAASGRPRHRSHGNGIAKPV